jgi:hypothetical protein
MQSLSLRTFIVGMLLAGGLAFAGCTNPAAPNTGSDSFTQWQPAANNAVGTVAPLPTANAPTK